MRPGNWKALYRKAILETDTTARKQELSEAEAAIAARVRELFHQAGAEVEVERDALDDAHYALHALKDVLEQNPHAA